MFEWLFSKKKFEGKEEPDMTKDERMTAKAIEDGAEDKAELDESVGEQEHLEGDEDTQSAKDRVDESIGAEEADEVKEVEAEEAEVEEMPPEFKAYIDHAIEASAEKIAQKVLAMLESKEKREVKEAPTETAKAMADALRIWN